MLSMNTTKGHQMQATNEIQVGQIFCTIWGYSMRLYDFYKVTKVAGKLVTFEKMEKTETYDGQDFRPLVTPTDKLETKFPETLRRRQNQFGYFKDIGNTVWDGQPKREDHLD